MFRSLIFDMDGVLIDSEPVYERVELGIHRELGTDMDAKKRLKYVGTPTREMWTQVKAKYGLEESVDFLVELEKQRMFEAIYGRKENDAIKGVVPLVEEMKEKGIKMAVASSSAKDDILSVVKSIGIDEYMEFLVSSNQVERGKPEPDVFLFTAETMGVNPNECLVIEDSRQGVTAALKAGMKCIGFDQDNKGTQDLSIANIVVDDISDIDYKLINALFNE